MAAPFPAMRVDHVSIAMRAIGPTLARWQRLFPVRLRTPPRAGYDGEFRWTDFFLGDRKLELIESARPGSFVERFLAAYGQRWHHLSLDLEEGALDRYAAALEQGGLRIVDRGDYGGGDQTAFISPRTAPGILVQFWQVPGFRGEAPADYPTDPIAKRDGIRFRAGPLTLAVRSIDDALAWFRRTFLVEVPAPKRPSPAFGPRWPPPHLSPFPAPARFASATTNARGGTPSSAAPLAPPARRRISMRASRSSSSSTDVRPRGGSSPMCPRRCAPSAPAACASGWSRTSTPAWWGCSRSSGSPRSSTGSSIRRARGSRSPTRRSSTSRSRRSASRPPRRCMRATRSSPTSRAHGLPACAPCWSTARDGSSR